MRTAILIFMLNSKVFICQSSNFMYKLPEACMLVSVCVCVCVCVCVRMCVCVCLCEKEWPKHKVVYNYKLVCLVCMKWERVWESACFLPKHQVKFLVHDIMSLGSIKFVFLYCILAQCCNALHYIQQPVQRLATKLHVFHFAMCCNTRHYN
jgi:hypothetical protein